MNCFRESAGHGESDDLRARMGNRGHGVRRRC